MTNPVPTPDLVPPPERTPRTGILRVLYGFEDGLLVVCLASMMLLPVAEIILRSVFHTGISGSSAIVQHLTLMVGMVGGAIAARDGRLLALSPVQTLLKGWAKTAAQIFSSALAAALCGLAAWAPGPRLHWEVAALIALGAATLLGAPVFTALGGAALILF